MGVLVRFKGDYYTNVGFGLDLVGPCEIQVSEETAKYLITNFPNWFEEIEVETKEDKLKIETKKVGRKRKTNRK